MEYVRSTLGEVAWQDGLTPEPPADERIPNPCTAFDGGDERHRARQDT
ncbi:hypothetical protein [Actinoallomurus acaciae]|uniref:Uncharacterized protein n=1 Tax=Actinoallomurus acaciae TaxID=502577 RepID=A0ABV5YC58_9ACTN